MTAWRRIVTGIVVGTAISFAGTRDANAFIFHDALAFAQRVTQLYEFIVQTREIIQGAKDNLRAFQDAYNGLKDWRNLGWLDTLKILDSPWLDGVQDIDQIRLATTVTVMTTEQAVKLWGDLDHWDDWRTNPRYKEDSWYRHKVDSLMRQSKRARDQRAAFLRMLQSQNKQLTEDIEKIKRIRDAIEAENQHVPVNQAKVTSLQAELAATEGKHQSESTFLANQRAIMFLVGADEAQHVYLETTESDWLDGNSHAFQDFGRGFSR